jgi:hypothetical protein
MGILFLRVTSGSFSSRGSLAILLDFRDGIGNLYKLFKQDVCLYCREEIDLDSFFRSLNQNLKIFFFHEKRQQPEL